VRNPARDRLLSLAPFLTEGGSDVGSGKVIALVEQGAACGLGQRIGDAVAEVQSRGVTPLAAVQVGLAGNLRLFWGNRGNLDLGPSKQRVELPAGGGA
jgi:hypothetical protein